MKRLRRILNRQVSVAELVQFGLWSAVAYLLLGAVWVVAHYGTVVIWQEYVSRTIPAAGELIGLGFSTVLWPALLLLPTVCQV